MPETARTLPRNREDQFLADWIAKLRDTNTRQAQGEYISSLDPEACCVVQHGMNLLPPPKGIFALDRRQQLERNYGEGFIRRVERRNYQSLPEIADYIEQERGL